MRGGGQGVEALQALGKQAQEGRLKFLFLSFNKIQQKISRAETNEKRQLPFFSLEEGTGGENLGEKRGQWRSSALYRAKGTRVAPV